jgi:hypothetical protein
MPTSVLIIDRAEFGPEKSLATHAPLRKSAIMQEIRARAQPFSCN